MNEGILLAAILVVALVLAARPWYRAITGKSSGCVGCPGACGPTCSCSGHHEEMEEKCGVSIPNERRAEQDKTS